MDGITLKNIEDVAPYAGANAISGIRFRPLRQALGVSSWGMNVLELEPHCGGYPEHDHESDGQEEVYVVLRGSILLHAADGERLLAAGDCVRVSPETKRKFVTLAEGATLLALGGTPGQPYGAAMARQSAP